MGQRYSTILNKLGHDVFGADKELALTLQAIKVMGDKSIEGVIIATPTNTHLDAINLFSYYMPHMPILCEKPIDIAYDFRNWGDRPLTMVNQYKYLVDDPDRIGLTYYNYFNHGKDGMAWDCINIIGMANDDLVIKEDSARWTCYINGQRLDLRDMDLAYIRMIKDWLANPQGNRDYIQRAHQRVIECLEEGEKSRDLEKLSHLRVVK